MQNERDPKATKNRAAHEATKAYANLNLFGAIEALTDASLFTNDDDTLEAVQEIGRICRRASQLELTKYELAMRALGVKS